jgi:hypothetical protein
MERNFSRRRTQQQRSFARHAQTADATHFFNLLTGPQLLECVEAHLPEHRERKFPPTATLAMFLGQVMSADRSCQNAVNAAVTARLMSGLTPGSVKTGGYCQARARLPFQMVRALARASAMHMGERTAQEWLWRGRHVKLVDGTSVSMPDTAENQLSYAQPGCQRCGAGFPVARLVGVISLSNGAVLDVAMGPYKGKGTGEYALLRSLLDCFAEGDVMLADSYFCCYFLIADMITRGVDVLFEQHGSRNRVTDFRKGQRLGPRDHLMIWPKPAIRPKWLSEERYKSYPEAITMREVKVGKKVLATTFLSARKTSKAALGELFWQRWHVELDFRNIKTTLGMETLSCLSPKMCEKEIWIYLLAYNLIRLLMAEAAHSAAILPRQISFKHTLQMWSAWSHTQFRSVTTEDTTWLFRLIAQVRVGNRPGRMEPRVIKRRLKPYFRMSGPRWIYREMIKKHGHLRKLNLN